MNWELQIIEGPSVGYQKLINKPGRLLIGRDSTCDLPLPDPSLSRRHCLIEFGSDDVKLIDLGSRNGTFVNGQKIQEIPIHVTDKIRVGKHILQVVEADAGTCDPTRAKAPEVLICSQCGQPIPPADIKERKTTRRGNNFYCAKCISQGIEVRPSAKVTQRMEDFRKVATVSLTDPSQIPQASASSGPAKTNAPDVAEPSPAPPLFPKYIGNYEILEILGEGGMGLVYKARHTFLDTLVALKVIKEEMTQHSEIVERFIQEAKLGAKLKHPNIIIIYDAGQADKIFFISMEFFSCRDLSSVIKKDGPMPYPRVLQFAIQIADALDYAHKHGVIHRDVKPSNVLVSTTSELAKLGDFGLAKAWQSASAQQLTASGQTLGTIQYISPEQLEDSRNVDPQTDIFSLGASLYFMLAGVPPFGQEPIGKVIHNILHNDPPHLPNIPSEMETVLLKSMAKQRKSRFASMEEFKEALMGIKLP